MSSQFYWYGHSLLPKVETQDIESISTNCLLNLVNLTNDTISFFILCRLFSPIIGIHTNFGRRKMRYRLIVIGRSGNKLSSNNI